ncbi:hypothetical protein P691DRAFT_720318 [Macrolepiota fuliginosa MF-IS2]|uniref:RNA-binding protein VTS1 n=1 Tax=Macrolepiota fuliginosa MF-IS2 TaxID=1400762 RepID=A0A9P5XKN4_9AGAR|nr:hypothetical protein P691DRAFT_720318 [Macrolepiota fuliginosa MF-IS2]
MSLRPPSTSPSPSPGPSENGKVSARQSMGPSARGTPTLVPGSPRPGPQSSARPTSELLGSAGMFQTPEAEALDQWFENLQNYEATLEDMAAASLDVNFKEELGAIEQWFKVLSEAERTAALYSLLQHSTQVQIRFFITVLQQMARADPMTALLSPAMGSMQNQMEASIARMKSPGLKSNMPASPTTRNFSANRQSLILDNNSNFLSPDSAAAAGATGASDAAATLAQQRAKLKANNAIHRISAPVLASATGDIRASWGAASQLAQVSEANAPPQEIVIGSSRPKSSDFSGTLPSPHLGGGGTGEGDSWASMVNTPAIPLFPKNTQSLDSASTKLNEWSKTTAPGVPRMGDPTIHRRKPATEKGGDNGNGQHYDDNGNPLNGAQSQDQRGRNPSGGMRNASGGGWGGRGQAPNGTTSNSSNNNNNNNGGRNGNNNNPNEDPNVNGLGVQLGGIHLGMGSPQMPGLPGLFGAAAGNVNAAAAAAALAGMNMGGPMSPYNMNMLSAMAMSPEMQLLAAQAQAQAQAAAAAGGHHHHPGGWLGMHQPMSAGAGLGSAASHLGGGMGMGSGRRPAGGPMSGRSPGLRSASSAGSRGDGGNGGVGGGGTPKGEEDVDPALLNDIPAWLRSLRLHKYTPNFEMMKWQDIVMLDEAQLEGKGVAALGARRKMLKTFEVVRKKMGMEGGVGSVPNSAASVGVGVGLGNGNGVANGNGNGNVPNSAAI